MAHPASQAEIQTHQHAAGRHVIDFADTPFLAADVGGTHARIGLVRGSRGDGHVSVLAYHKYVCADWPSLTSILGDFRDREGFGPVSHCALACAGYPIDGVVINDNLPWPVRMTDVRKGLDLDDLALINDFEALAYATRFLDPAQAKPLTATAHASQQGPSVVVGPGTGLGSAVLLEGAEGKPVVLATEAGQTSLAPGTALERAILEVLADGDHYVSCEQVLSGPGVLNLYRALCTLQSMPAVYDTPEAVTAAAMRGDDARARQALEVFCGLFGSFVGDLALLYGAGGGIWLAGGILPQIRDFFVRSRFVERFLDKGRMRAFLERVPVRLMEHGQLGVIGAAGWYLEHHSSDQDDSSRHDSS